jgi:hypothetical protein
MKETNTCYKPDILSDKGYVVLRDRRGADCAGRVGVPSWQAG